MSWETVARSSTQSNDKWRDVASSNTGNYELQKNSQGDEIGLGDILLDTFHMAGATGDAINDDGTPDTSGDFFGGSDANERLGLGIQNASGYKGDIKPEYRSEISEPNTNGGRVRQVIGEIGKGLQDLLSGGTIGAATTVADIIKLVDTDNSVADDLRLASDVSQEHLLNYPKGAANAVGQEIGSMAITAPIGGKAADLLMGTGKLVKNAIGKQIVKKSDDAIKEQGVVSDRRVAGVKDRTPEFRKNNVDEINAELNAFNKGFDKRTSSPKSPQIGLISETIGKLSPTAEKIINKYWAKLLSPVSKRASTEMRFSFIRDMMENGYTNKQANEMWRNITPAKQTAIDALFKSPSKTGSAIGALFGSQSNDNK